MTKKMIIYSSAAAAAKGAASSGGKSVTAPPQPTPATRPAYSKLSTRKTATIKPRWNSTATSLNCTQTPIYGCRDTPLAGPSVVFLALRTASPLLHLSLFRKLSRLCDWAFLLRQGHHHKRTKRGNIQVHTILVIPQIPFLWGHATLRHQPARSAATPWKLSATPARYVSTIRSKISNGVSRPRHTLYAM